jgi:hypothetical protein
MHVRLLPYRDESTPVDRYIFPGYPDFVERAIEDLGFPVPFAWGRIPQTLAGLANLCAQASVADRDHVAMILREASLLRDQILVASMAAELMLEEVTRARGALQAEPRAIPTPRDPRAGQDTRPTPAKAAVRSGQLSSESHRGSRA